MSRMPHHRCALLVSGMLLLAAIAGCQSMDRPALDANGIPDQRYMIGASLVFEYEALNPGIFILVDKTHHKTVFIKSLDAGESFSLGPDELKEEDVATLLGKNPLENQYRLYFIPHPPAAATQPTK